MAQVRPFKPSSLPLDVKRMMKDDHRHILALFQCYFALPPDSRRAIVEQILYRLEWHLEMEDDLLLQRIRKSGSQARKLLSGAQVEHEQVKVMILELRQTEMDEEAFKGLMQKVGLHFLTEKRDLLPLVDRSLDA
jgi:hypothetical protein